MPLLIRALALALVSLAVSTPGAAAQDADAQEAVPGSELEVFLVTAGPGDAIWERFSHNALWIRDNATGRSTAYNWGIFSFEQENFVLRLVKGQMLYAMYGLDMQRMAAQYARDNRELTINPVNLTPAERLELYRTLQALDNDQDRHYRYDYYRDNCSTRVRDALDAVLGGQIQERWSDEPAGTTYRWHTRRLLSRDPWAVQGIDVIMGNRVDRELTAWDEMFLPLPTQRYLEQTQVTRGDGTTVPLLGPRQLVSEADRLPVPAGPARTLPLWLAAGGALAALLAALARGGAAGSTWARRLFGLIGGLWNLILGLFGSMVLLMWVFTDHVFTFWNENLLQMSPLNLVLAVWLLALMGGRGQAQVGRWSRMVALASLVGLAVQVLPGFDQVNGTILALTVGPSLAVAWGAGQLAAPGS